MPPRKIYRATLNEDLYPCDTAQATLIYYDRQSGVCDIQGQGIIIIDTLGTVLNDVMLVELDDDLNAYMPAGTCCYVYQSNDDMESDSKGNFLYEPLAFGACCELNSEEWSEESEESEESSEESEESSEESEEESNESQESSVQESSVECIPVTGGALGFPGYLTGVNQVLGHGKNEAGCDGWMWFNVGHCGGESSE
jgi:hypothetical protein